MNAYTILEEVRQNVAEGIGIEKRWTDKELLNKITFAYKKAFVQLMKVPGDYLTTSTLLTPSSSVITLPSDFGKFVYLEEYTSKIPIHPLSTIRDRSKYADLTYNLYGDAPFFYFVGNTLEVTADNYSTQVKLWYQKKPIELSAGVAASGAASSLGFDTGNGAKYIDDYYNGQSVEITSGTGKGIISTISDYVGSTAIATITGTAAANDTYGIVLVTPEEANEYIILEATLMALAKPSAAIDPKYFEYMQARTNDAKKTYVDFVSKRISGNGSVRVTPEG